MSDEAKDICPGCQGSGKCLKCNGTGNVVQSLPSPITVISGESQRESKTWRTCNRCYGSGICEVCKGTGKAHAATS